jgi:hypothetical protein
LISCRTLEGLSDLGGPSIRQTSALSHTFQRHFEPPFQLEQRDLATMAETTKLSVEKALEKIRGSDSPKSKNTRLDEKMDALDEEIKRMRAQRLRLEPRQRKRD